MQILDETRRHDCEKDDVYPRPGLERETGAEPNQQRSSDQTHATCDNSKRRPEWQVLPQVSKPSVDGCIGDNWGTVNMARKKLIGLTKV